MNLIFPEAFRFGTSTSAYQTETAFDHDWQDIVARDGEVFSRTTDHEKRYESDASIIASLAPNYRMSLMWSRLQRGPMEELDREALREYSTLLSALRSRGVSIMMVLHHFANPRWFAQRGGWELSANIPLWVDYARKVVDEVGADVSSWNTFNEPNLYTAMGWVAGEFPPFKKNILTARRVIENISEAHRRVYEYIKTKHPAAPVGISHNCTVFAAENLAGQLPARIADWLYMEYAAGLFASADFFGMSYYGRIGFDPFPVTYINTPQKIRKRSKEHDDMWEYYPQGLKECLTRYWNRFGKPMVITENGICTSDDTLRVKAIRDYLRVVHDAIAGGVDVRGYYHWSAWDNFEWNLGPTYQFGLYECDRLTKERRKKPSADFFAGIAFSNRLPPDDQ